MGGGVPEGLSNLDDLWDDRLPDPAESASVEASSDLASDLPGDQRLYLPDWEGGWQAHVKTSWEREYCFAKSPGEDFYHLLMAGELYVEYDSEKFCLECARRRGAISGDRLHWKRGVE